RIHRLVEGEPDGGEEVVGKVANHRAGVDLGAQHIEGDRELVAGDFPGDEVAVLVHGVAERVVDVRPDHPGGLVGEVGGELDVELRVGVVRRRDAESGGRETTRPVNHNLVGGEGGRVHRLVERNLLQHGVQRARQIGTAGRDARSGHDLGAEDV